MLLFADDTLIMQCDKTFGGSNGVKALGNGIGNGHKINVKLILDHNAFLNLIALWIEPCAAMMREIDPAVPDEKKVIGLFYPDGDPQEQKDFLNRFIDFIKGYDPYETEIWPQCPEDRIVDSVDDALKGAPPYLRLRVEIVCLLCGFLPHQVFAEGTAWPSPFLPDRSKTERMEIKEGDEFVLSLAFKGGERLTPRTLYNAGGAPCRITIRCGGEEYPVTVPPCGVLRAVFSDAECKRLACVKGNLSFNSSAAQNALIQLPSPQGPRLFLFHRQSPRAIPLSLAGAYLDASVDGKGGVRVLQGEGIYDYSKGRTLKRKTLPIRIYGAGGFWAEQYADGGLNTNMQRNGESVERAWAIVEDADYSLLFADEQGAWRCVGNTAVQISEKEFVSRMLDRFRTPGCCERVACDAMTLTIGVDGRLA